MLKIFGITKMSQCLDYPCYPWHFLPCKWHASNLGKYRAVPCIEATQRGLSTLSFGRAYPRPFKMDDVSISPGGTNIHVYTVYMCTCRDMCKGTHIAYTLIHRKSCLTGSKTY